MSTTRVVYALLFLSSSAAACELPKLPVIPATIGDDVASVLRDTRRYSDELVAYTECIKGELAAAGGQAAPASLRALLVARNNQAVAEHKTVTDLYTARVGPLANLRLAEYVPGEGRDCLLGSAIVRTGVVNDGAVVFFLRGDQAYLNVLPAACPGLESDGGFAVADQPATSNLGRGFQTPLASRVCDQDRIFPYKEGAARRVVGCPLGRFYAVEEEQALQILAALGRAPAPSDAATR